MKLLTLTVILFGLLIAGCSSGTDSEEIAVLEAKISSLESTQAELVTTIESLRAKLITTIAEVARKDASVSSRFTGIKNSLEDLEDEIYGQFNFSVLRTSRIDDVEDELEDLKDEVYGYPSYLSNIYNLEREVYGEFGSSFNSRIDKLE